MASPFSGSGSSSMDDLPLVGTKPGKQPSLSTVGRQEEEGPTQNPDAPVSSGSQPSTLTAESVIFP